MGTLMRGLSRGSRTTLAFCACAAILNVPRLHNTRAVPRANATVIILMPCLLATHSLDPTRTSGDVRLRAAVVGIVQARLDRNPDKMRARRQTVEHPFGTIKAWMGATHFLTRTIERVSTEMSLHVLAYNMKRVIKLLGSEAVMKAMRA